MPLKDTLLTGKQKRFLRAMGSGLDPVVQVGKGGVNAAVIQSTREVLAVRELIKVRVLQNSPDEPNAVIAGLAEAAGAELVQVIGRNGLLYKKNIDKPKIELP
ncbi:MAG: ribosome assembly RNA-binding protein YhbY [Veillonellales bacterium]